MTEQELVNLIADHLPINTEDAKAFVDAVQKGYTWGNINYGMALSLRDARIECLEKELEALRKVACCFICNKDGDTVLDVAMRELYSELMEEKESEII